MSTPLSSTVIWNLLNKDLRPKGGVFRTDLAESNVADIPYIEPALGSGRSSQSSSHRRACPPCSRSTRPSKIPLPTASSSLAGTF